MTRRVVVGIVLVMAALGIAGAAAAMFETSQANSEKSQEVPQSAARLTTNDEGTNPVDSPILKGNAQADEDDVDGDADAVETKPYIGIVVETLSEADAEEHSLDGGVLVLRVVEGGPSDGSLEADDVITAIDGEGIGSARKVVEIVQASEPDDILTFSVVRNGELMDVGVTVGEREIRIIKRNFDYTSPMIPQELMELAEGGFDSFVRAEVVIEAEDGAFKTVRAVTGTVQEDSIDIADGSFALNPRDGSDAIQYLINDETRVFLNQMGSIEGLNGNEKTLVVDVIDANGDSSVMIVVQGEFLNMIDRFKGFGNHGMGFDHSDRSFGPNLHRFHGFDFDDVPEVRERFRFIIPGELDRFERGHFEFDDDVVPHLEELLEDLPFDLDNFEMPDSPVIENVTPDSSA